MLQLYKSLAYACQHLNLYNVLRAEDGGHLWLCCASRQVAHVNYLNPSRTLID